MSIWAEVRSFSRREKLFVLFATLVGFSIACEYGVTRPASTSIFLNIFSIKALPWVWLLTLPLNLLVVLLYNRFLPKFGPLCMFYAMATIVIAVHLFLYFFLKNFPAFIFFQYAWKEVYVLLMFKQLWSMIHSTIQPARAKYLYGLIFGMGTLGAVVGNAIPGFSASYLGSEKLFLFTLPLYLFMMASFAKAFHLSEVEEGALRKEPRLCREGFALVLRNRTLIAALLLVILMQVSVAIAEYQFNAHLELNIADKDLRTEYYGRLMGLMNLISIALQLLGSFLIISFLGLQRTHLLIPLILLGNALLFSFLPTFAIVSFVFIFLKAIDFSLFGVIREMLFLPLTVDEKYRAKAVIDVFAWRSCKALVSLVVLLLQSLLGAMLLPALSYASITIFLIWILVVVLLVRKALPLTVKVK